MQMAESKQNKNIIDDLIKTSIHFVLVLLKTLSTILFDLNGA